MFLYANELTPFETKRSQELLQTARILNIRECIPSYIPVFRWNQISIVLHFIIYEDKLTKFLPATEDEVKSIINSSPSKSCELDPLSTWLLKACLPELLPLITRIINTSLNSGTLPMIF